MLKSIADVKHDYEMECKYKYSKVVKKIKDVIQERLKTDKQFKDIHDFVCNTDINSINRAFMENTGNLDP